LDFCFLEGKSLLKIQFEEIKKDFNLKKETITNDEEDNGEMEEEKQQQQPTTTNNEFEETTLAIRDKNQRIAIL